MADLVPRTGIEHGVGAMQAQAGNENGGHWHERDDAPAAVELHLEHGALVVAEDA